MSRNAAGWIITRVLVQEAHALALLAEPLRQVPAAAGLFLPDSVLQLIKQRFLAVSIHTHVLADGPAQVAVVALAVLGLIVQKVVLELSLIGVLLGIQDGKKRFADLALAMSKAFTLCCTLAFFQAVKVILTKREISQQKKTDEARELAIRQIISAAVVSEEVVDIFDAVGLDKPNIGILDDAFLAEVRNLPERNLAVELLERLLECEIKSRFAGNVVQNKKFSDMLTDVVQRYQNRSIEAAQVMEELVQMAKKFREAAARGEQLGLTEDEGRFYDALANNESAVRELTDETLKKIAHELAENLRKNLTAAGEGVGRGLSLSDVLSAPARRVAPGKAQ